MSLPNRKLVLTAIGLPGILLLTAVAGWLLGLGGPSSTTAEDYTSAEVREIFDLLRNDPACRDTRLGDSFTQDIISLELLDAVLGQPVTKAGSGHRLIWVYKTGDGTATITPFGVWEDIPEMAETVPSLDMQGSVQIVGLNTAKPVDRETLKQTIIGIKSRFDDGDGVQLAQQMADQRGREIAAREAEATMREEQQQKELDELNARVEAERVAEIARWEEQQQEQNAQVAARQRILELSNRAENDFFNLRDELPVGPEKGAFAKQQEDWLQRRVEALSSAMEAGRDWQKLPLPETDAILSALAAGKPAPVVAAGASE